MYYVRSTTNASYTLNGKVIPSCNKEYLVCDSGFVTMIKDTPVTRSLLNAGSIIILDEEPSEMKNTPERLGASVLELRSGLKAAQDEAEMFKEQLEQAQVALAGAREELASVKEQLAKARMDED